MKTKNTINSPSVLIAAMLGIAAVAVYAEPNQTGKFQEHPLCSMPSFIPGSFFNLTKSETINGCRIAWAERRGAKWAVVIDGQAGPEYDGIGDITFSFDGKHVAYGARRNKWFVSNKWFVVVDSQVGSEYDGIGDIFFSPDGKHAAYGARRNKWFVSNKWFVVVDGQAGPEHDGIRDITFSLDGKHVAYGARRSKWLVNKWFVVVDSQPGPEYDGIMCGPVFLKDGIVEYIAMKGGFLYRVNVMP
jgi:dipeptidyl aminopeptidase/acylaminoacyl peptidase